MVIKTNLEQSGLQVDCVANGREAVDALRGLPYDIVLMDVSMPEMDGMAATHEIRQLPGRTSNIPIVAITAHALSGDRERFLAAGMDDYLTKPIDKSAMLQCIAHRTDPEKAMAPNSGPMRPQGRVVFSDSGKKYVDESVLQQLAKDTASDLVPGLIKTYVEVAAKQLSNIQDAVREQNIDVLEFEAHTLGSSAKAYGNIRLSSLARRIEHLCRKAENEQALAEAASLPPVARESLELLARRAKAGFE